MADLTIANTILAQLGGNKFRAMTGARNLAGGDRDLSFTLPKAAKDGINRVQIELTDENLYTVRFYRGPVLDIALVSEHTLVTDENLRELFTERTGLDCTLGTCAG